MQNPREKVRLVIPALGKLRQVDPWSSLASQPSLFGEFKVSEGLGFETKGREHLWEDT